MNHHAHLLIGEILWAKSVIPEEDTRAEIDTVYREFDRLGIDDVRTLVHESSRSPLVHSHRVFILYCREMTLQAQNALLKLFEDPTESARFYLIVPTESILISTLRSRLSVLSVEQKPETNTEEIRTFMRSTYAERLSRIAEFVKRDDDSWIRPFLNALEQYVESKHEASVLSEIIYVRTQIGAQGASKKMLLEHLALSLPPMI